jgi:hypothetical protein
MVAVRGSVAEATAFFAALEDERWTDAVDHLSRRFMAEFAEEVRFRLGSLKARYESLRDLEIPMEESELFSYWLATSDYRAKAARELAQARFEESDSTWRIAGGIPAPNRAVVGEVSDREGHCIVVYRSHGVRYTLQLCLEDGRWLICSDDFSREGHPGLTALPSETDSADA